ncbi:hypothetical protein R83H12_02472 [Fibrobacteria bacterium R8-3-H12]
MRIAVFTLAAAVSLAVFACSESPSSAPDEGSSNPSSSVVTSSSSGAFNGSKGRACQYPGEDFGVSGLFVCGEAPSDMADLQTFKSDCKDEGGTWINACPSGEKTTCIYEEDEYDKNVLYKIYADSLACGDLLMKNTDGNEDIVQKGGACGPFTPKTATFSMCAEFPELPTSIVKLSCADLETTFASECPSDANLVCYDPDEEMIYYFYDEAMSSLTCGSIGLESL